MMAFSLKIENPDPPFFFKKRGGQKKPVFGASTTTTNCSTATCSSLLEVAVGWMKWKSVSLRCSTNAIDHDDGDRKMHHAIQRRTTEFFDSPLLVISFQLSNRAIITDDHIHFLCMFCQNIVGPWFSASRTLAALDEDGSQSMHMEK